MLSIYKILLWKRCERKKYGTFFNTKHEKGA